MEEEMYFTWQEILDGKHKRKTNPDPVVKPILERFQEESSIMLLRGFMGNPVTFLVWARNWWELEVQEEHNRRGNDGFTNS